MNLKIERGIPIPAATTRSGGNMELLRTMEVGDSVYFAPDVTKKATRFYRVAKKLGVHVIIRKDGNGMRMWRTTAPIEALGVAVAAPKPAPKKKVAKSAAKLAAQGAPKPKRDYKAERAKKKANAEAKPDMAAVKARVPARVKVATQ